MNADQVFAALAAAPLTYTDEISLHEVMSDAFTAAGIDHHREVRLTGPEAPLSFAAAPRIDFLTDSGVGIEVKVAGSLTAVARQMLRYAHYDAIQELVLVTAQASHHAIPDTLAGKPVGVYSLIGRGL